jgi:hypothetical protein
MYTVDINSKAMKFCTVVVKPYHCNKLTKAFIDTGDGNDNVENTYNVNWIPDELQPTRRKREYLASSRNK